MRRGSLFVAVVGALLCVSEAARAECTKDVDCKGDRVCEGGECKDPAALPPPPAPPVAAPAVAPAEAPPSHPAASAPPPPAPAAAPLVPAAGPTHDAYFFDDDPPTSKPKKRIGKPGVLAVGIVLTAAAPIVLMAGVLSSTCNRYEGVDCADENARLLGLSVASLALLGAGIPLIVIGAKRVPVRSVSAAPWIGPRDGGLVLRLTM